MRKERDSFNDIEVNGQKTVKNVAAVANTSMYSIYDNTECDGYSAASTKYRWNST